MKIATYWWAGRRHVGRLSADEPGNKASVTAAGGYETPNDMTVFVGEKAAGSDPADKPVAIDLPVHAFAPTKRPQVALKVTPPEDDESDEEADALELWR